jgi:serine/threonine protein kinase/tetratricopeptide (TPR) repeat protein
MNEEDIFHEALARGSPQERAAYLEQACAGNRALRASVEALLRANVGACGFLDRFATVDEPPQPPIAERPGTVIGPYKLLEQIGEGGFGIVFMAEQQHPVRRKAALKVLKPGMDTRQVVARFEAERQALALMDHPNIAHVLDAGETAGGRPYLVMDLVRGIPITEFCDQARLNLNDRLHLFIHVCQGVQHAHQKGIIHRDLKPSNVLVMLHDDKPVVKIIDFGVAKALGQQLIDKTLFTNFAQLIGTPLYMSPEQAQLTGLDIDTRSDIYSLGVLLYKLLTGTTPFDKERLKSASFDEIRRIIREEEPPKPSTRISTLGPGSRAVSARRRSDPKHLSHLLRGDLDWIVMKALEKDRTRRYDSASAFATDIEHYLHDEQVVACPPSTWYRLQKFARRNRGALVAAGLISAALVLTIIVLAVSTLLVAQERDLARQAAANEAEQRSEADKQRRQAVTERGRAEQSARDEAEQRRRAEANMRQTREAVDRFLTHVAEDMAGKPHMEKIRRALLEDALKFYKGFLEEKGTDPVIKHETALAYLRVAQVQGWLGNMAQGEAPARRAIHLFEQLSAEHPASKEYRQDLANARSALGNCLYHLLRFDEALAEWRHVLSIWENLAKDFPAVLDYRRGIVSAHCRLGAILHPHRRREEAEKEYRCALALEEELRRDFPKEPEDRATMFAIQSELGSLLSLWNRFQEAELRRREAVRLADELGWEETAVRARVSLAETLLSTGKQEEAERYCRQSQAWHEKRAEDFPDVLEYRFQLWWIYGVLSDALFAMNRWKESEEPLRQSVIVQRKMCADHPDDTRLQMDLGQTYAWLGALLHFTGRPQEASDTFRLALEQFEKGIARPQDTSRGEFLFAEFLATCPAPQFRDPSRGVQLAKKALQSRPLGWEEWGVLGSALYRAGKWQEAQEALQKAMELGNGGVPSHWFHLAMVHWQRGDPKEARKWYDKAVAWNQKNRSGDVRDYLLRAEAAALLGVANGAKPKEKPEPAGKR